KRSLVGSATRQASLYATPLLLRQEDLDRIVEERERTTIPENVEKILLYIQHRCPRPGQRVKIEGQYDYTVIDAKSLDEFQYIMNYAHDLGFLTYTSGNPIETVLTPQGWERVSARPSGFVAGRCFVAMSFHPSLSAAYFDGILKAIEDDC